MDLMSAYAGWPTYGFEPGVSQVERISIEVRSEYFDEALEVYRDYGWVPEGDPTEETNSNGEEVTIQILTFIRYEPADNIH
jgi:hypothetical protein